ncbi:MAG: YihY/virulence factor BrkB family protein [Chloroflexi bacterium]|nr:YihY/virulence factor BrkB family protein [Chloroflexota bacterium]
MKLKDVVPLVKETVSEWSEDNATRLAAALAYYTVFSIPPLLIIALAIAGQVFEREVAQQQLVNQVVDLAGSGGESIGIALESILENVSQPEGSLIAIIIGVVTLFFGASGVFGELHSALNTIWEIAPKPGRGILGTLKDRFFSFTMVLGIGFLLLVSLVLTTVLSALGDFFTGLMPETVVVMQIFNQVVSFGLITVLFALIFKVIPDVEIAWRDVWIGAAATALLFTLGKLLIGLYLGNSAVASTYGAAGSLIVILLWVYYSAQILFLGAEFTQVYANRHGSRIVADDDAISLTETMRVQQGIPHHETVAQAQAQQNQPPPQQPASIPAGAAAPEKGLAYRGVINTLTVLLGLYHIIRGQRASDRD